MKETHIFKSSHISKTASSQDKKDLQKDSACSGPSHYALKSSKEKAHNIRPFTTATYKPVLKNGSDTRGRPQIKYD